MKKIQWRTAFQILSALLVLVLCAGGVGLLGRTLVAWWLPVAVAAAVALLFLPLFLPRWRRLTGSCNTALNAAVHFCIVGAVAFFALLCVNYSVERSGSGRTERAEVVEKVRHRHTRYRRVGRNRRVPDGYTWTYGLRLRLPDGRELEQPVGAEVYRRSRCGSQRDVALRTGILGFDVF